MEFYIAFFEDTMYSASAALTCTFDERRIARFLELIEPAVAFLPEARKRERYLICRLQSNQ
jgi:hypothetical protein